MLLQVTFVHMHDQEVISIMKVIIIAIVGLACHLVAAYQEDACCALCSSLGAVKSNPGKSCHDIYQINKATRGVSGNYWINTTTGVHQVYCDMELECGGHKGGSLILRLVREMIALQDGLRLLLLLLLVYPLAAMRDATQLNSQLIVSHMANCMEWHRAIKAVQQMDWLRFISPTDQLMVHM